ncbi:hypothetical protein HN51_049931 [Arachis hypogaea]
MRVPCVPLQPSPATTKKAAMAEQETDQLEYIIPEESSLEQHLLSDTMFIDFVRYLLSINPKRRPTARQALKHPWLSHESLQSHFLFVCKQQEENSLPQHFVLVQNLCPLFFAFHLSTLAEFSSAVPSSSKDQLCLLFCMPIRTAYLGAAFHYVAANCYFSEFGCDKDLNRIFNMD